MKVWALIMLLLCVFGCSSVSPIVVESTAPVSITVEDGDLQVVSLKTKYQCQGVPLSSRETVKFRCEESGNAGLLTGVQSFIDEVSDSVTIPFALVLMMILVM